MDRDDLIRQLMGTFLDELDEHVETLNRDALALEKESDAAERKELLDTIFRTVHSLKGAARAVDIHVIETACHRLEEILGALRLGALSLDATIFELLFAGADALGEASRGLRQNNDFFDMQLLSLIPRLEGFPLASSFPASSGDDTVPDTMRSPVIAPSPALNVAPTDLARTPRSVSQVAPRVPESDADVTVDTQAETEESDAAPILSEQDAHRVPSGPTVRVPASKLDTLLTRTGELLLTARRSDRIVRDLESVQEFLHQWRRSIEVSERGRLRAVSGSLSARPVAAGSDVREELRQLGGMVDRIIAAAVRDFRAIGQSAADVDEEVHRLRLLPFGVACRGLERTVRDLALDSGKQAEFELSGADVEIDRSILEGLRDPLLHLVRNSVEHGIETPEVRMSAGKSASARVHISASLRGAQIEVVVADDGAGLNYQSIRAQIAKRGLTPPKLDRDLIQYLFRSGFSTSPVITRVSGRGVGLDVVKHDVEALHGTVQLSSKPGKGTRFVLTVPLTVTTIRALLLRVQSLTYALPITGIRGLVRLSPDELRSSGGRQTLLFKGNPIPVVSLGTILGVLSGPIETKGKMPAVVVAADSGLAALLVDELIAEQDIVIKNLGARIRRLRHISGAAVLQDGRIAFVLGTTEILASLLRSGAAPALTRHSEKRKQRILIADDSLTTRTLEKTILENAGYEVLIAVDGREAWQLLQQHGADLLVSDVEMPHMDGYELTATVRGSEQFRNLPVILLTSLDSDYNRERGLEVRANAYLVKTLFDQSELLEVIRQLI